MTNNHKNNHKSNHKSNHKNNTIDFNEATEKIEPLIWQCDCGNCSFMIYDNGDIECPACGSIQNGCDAHYQVVKKWTRKVENYKPAFRYNPFQKVLNITLKKIARLAGL